MSKPKTITLYGKEYKTGDMYPVWDMPIEERPKLGATLFVDLDKETDPQANSMINIVWPVVSFVVFGILSLGCWYILYQIYLFIWPPGSIFNQALRHMLGY